MSSYNKIKALRVPLAKYGYADDPYKVESENESAFNKRYGVDEKYFEVTCTQNGTYYLDYILLSDNDSEGEYTKCRDLTANEQAKYEGTFKQIIPSINMSDVHLVEYSWYNATEPADTYEPAEDPFNEEV